MMNRQVYMHGCRLLHAEPSTVPYKTPASVAAALIDQCNCQAWWRQSANDDEPALDMVPVEHLVCI